MRIIALAVVLGLGGCVEAGKPAAQNSGAADYADYCAACHGASGKGDGAAAAGLAKKPADLTTLAKRNHGTFPTTRVMAQIWGYAGKRGEGIMPDFAPLLEGEAVPFDGGDGIQTPTPLRLVQIAEYLKTLQAK
jgi:cytochrome c553